jgi:hypothetical protein
MALTRDFKQTIVERVRRDPALARCVQTTFRWMASLRPSTRRFAPAQDEVVFLGAITHLPHPEPGAMRVSRRTHGACLRGNSSGADLP